MAGPRVHAVRHGFCLTRVREGRVTPQEAVGIESTVRPTIGDIAMNRPLLVLSIAAALWQHRRMHRKLAATAPVEDDF